LISAALDKTPNQNQASSDLSLTSVRVQWLRWEVRGRRGLF